MVLVAVAGGTSPGLGRSIITALHIHPSHTPLVLSRASSPTPEWLHALGVPTRKVDYADPASLQTALEGVHTVISVLLAHDPDEWTRTQTALLHAAFAAGCVRFAPSDWGCGHRAYASISLLAAQSRVWGACAAAARESEGRFSWAGFQCGLFMNYLGVGAPREGEALAGKRDDGEHFFFVGDMRAEIPLGEGRRVPRVSMTEIGDVGRFVAAACGLERWEERMGMVGETVWMDEVVEMMEQVRGRKVEVVCRPLEKVREEKDTERDWGKIFWLELEEMYARDQEDEGVISPTLNRMCPEIRPMKIKEFLIKFWSEA